MMNELMKLEEEEGEKRRNREGAGDRSGEDSEYRGSHFTSNRKGPLRPIGVEAAGKLTEREVFILKWGFEHYFLKRDHLDQILEIYFGFQNVESRKVITKRILGHLIGRYHFLEKVILSFEEQQEYFVVTMSGIRFLMDEGLIPDGSRPVKLEHISLKHETFITRVRMLWDRLGHQKEWETARVMQLFLKEGESAKLPDLKTEFYSVKAARTFKIAIEVELTRKVDWRYTKTIQSYTRSDYDFVFYLVSKANIQQTVLNQAPQVDKFYVCLLEDLFREQGACLMRGPSPEDYFPIGKLFAASSTKV